MSLIGTKSVKQQEKSAETDELMDLLSKPSAKQAWIQGVNIRCEHTV